MSTPRRTGPGFTLIELLVVLGVVAVLIGLALPSLVGARTRALQAGSLMDLRQISISMELYLNDSKSRYPFHPPGEPYLIGPLDDPGGMIGSNQSPWDMRWAWPTVMHRVAPWRENYGTWIARESTESSGQPWMDGDGQWRAPVYHLSNSFTASPSTWAASDVGTPQVRVVPSAEVRFPAAKVLVFDQYRPYLRNPRQGESTTTRGVLLADSSASIRDDRSANPPIQNLLSEWGPTIYHDTPDGVLGRDFK